MNHFKFQPPSKETIVAALGTGLEELDPELRAALSLDSDVSLLAPPLLLLVARF